MDQPDIDVGDFAPSNTPAESIPLTSIQKANIRKIHNNCGHPSKNDFIRCLQLGGAQARVLRYIREEFKCEACEARAKRPKPRLPASMPKSFRFNEVIGMDCFMMKDYQGIERTFLNMICWGTLYQVCVEVPDKRATTIAQVFTDHWNLSYFC